MASNFKEAQMLEIRQMVSVEVAAASEGRQTPTGTLQIPEVPSTPDGRPKNVTRNLIPDGISQENLAEGRTPIQERYDKLPYKLENQYKGQKGQAKKVAESTSMGNDFARDIEVIEDHMAEAVSHSSSGGSLSKRMKVYEATVPLPRPSDQVSSGLGSGRQPQDSIPDHPIGGPRAELPNKITIQVVIIGDSGVGKTSLMKKFVTGSYGTYISTVMMDHAVRVITIDKTKVNLEIWDTAGMERHFNIIPNQFYRNAEGLILVFDVTRRESFENLYMYNEFGQSKPWVKVIKEKCDTAKVLLVGHKVDDGNNREVKKEEAQALANEYRMISYIETSSKADINVDEVFFLIARAILEDQQQVSQPQQQLEQPPMRLQPQQPPLQQPQKQRGQQRRLSTPQNLRQKSRCCTK